MEVGSEAASRPRLRHAGAGGHGVGGHRGGGGPGRAARPGRPRRRPAARARPVARSAARGQPAGLPGRRLRHAAARPRDPIVFSETTKAVTGLSRPRNWEAAVNYTGTEPLHRRIFAWTVGSFPSGHTVMATAVFGVTARMVRRHLGPGPATTAAEAAAAAAIATCAASRLALGVHWLSDIVGGVVVGEAAVRAVLAVERRLPRGRARRKQ
ncbi:MAG: phosphatase PAP2 family protein [Chloroflexi bacterium]|nr:MAG: phosphatase PAP2 family protein [Chloroflexota bacterium]